MRRVTSILAGSTGLPDSGSPGDDMSDGQASAAVPILTIGYGPRDVEGFLRTLNRHGVQYLIDVRSRPRSRFKPEFSQESLDLASRTAGIRYVFMGDTLGGRPSEPSCYTDGRVDYVKCREKPFFQAGLARLRSAWEQRLRVALMCSEAKPEECHRSKLIGTSLSDAGIEVLHIDEAGDLKTQDEVMQLLTGGQTSLFGDPSEASIPCSGWEQVIVPLHQGGAAGLPNHLRRHGPRTEDHRPWHPCARLSGPVVAPP
jgi:hypothetical protein